jgi:hypothetical protein
MSTVIISRIIPTPAEDETNHFRIICNAVRSWHCDKMCELEFEAPLVDGRNDPSEGGAWWHGWHDAGWRLRRLAFTDGHQFDAWCCPEHVVHGTQASFLSWDDAEQLAERIGLAAPRLGEIYVAQLYDGRPFIGSHWSIKLNVSIGPITSEMDWERTRSRLPASVFQKKGARIDAGAVQVSLL